MQKDTIFALSSATGLAALAVIRVCGPQAGLILKTLSRQILPPPRRASVRSLYDCQGCPLDEALVLFMPAPHSFSGEDMVELHVHGSVAVIGGVSEALFAQGAREAKPGEFSRRALENNKMDLTALEGVADLIDAVTQGQRQQAFAQMTGGLREVYEEWRAGILDALALIEGEIDFADEGDVPDQLSHRAHEKLRLVAGNIQENLAHSTRVQTIRDGIDIAIIGAPNAGKSSLLNALSGRQLAITSHHAGTTRDIIEVSLQIGGQLVRLADTAGLRESADEIEKEGVKRARFRAQNADKRIGVIDGNLLNGKASNNAIDETLDLLRAKDILLVNKADLWKDDKREGSEPLLIKKIKQTCQQKGIYTQNISMETNQGLACLEKQLIHALNLQEEGGIVRAGAGLTRARHVECAKQALRCLQQACQILTERSSLPELAGADLRESLVCLAELAGKSDIEAVLDRVFASFCIGK